MARGPGFSAKPDLPVMIERPETEHQASHVGPLPAPVGAQGSDAPVAQSVPYPSNFYAWYCVFVLLGIYLNSFLDRQILALLVGPIKATMGFTDSQVGFLMGPAFAIFYTIAGLPLGWLADRMSRRWLIGVGQIFWSIASITFGLGRTYTQLILARIGVGVGEASLSPSAYSMIADTFPPNRLARALSVYSMGIYVGGGLANLIGAQLTSVYPPEQLHEFPLVGERMGWQIIFFLVALPTIPLTLLLFTVKEPVRRGLGMQRDASGRLEPINVPIPMFLRYLWANRTTMMCHGFGFAFLSFSGYGAAAWLPEYFIRVHDWTRTDAGTFLGLAGITLGPAGLYFGGWLADWLTAKGYRDAKLRAGLVSAVVWVPFGAAVPLMPNGTLSSVMLVPALFLSAMPWGIAPAAIQEFVPNQMRGQASAVYLLIISLIGLGLGPQALALVTDYVFADEQQIHLSLLWTTLLAHIASAILLYKGLPAFRRSREYLDAWLQGSK